MTYEIKDIESPVENVLPAGYCFSSYQCGDEYRWAEMEVENNDFDTYDNAVKYFKNKYISEVDRLKDRFIGIRDTDGYLCGSVICWFDNKDVSGDLVSTVHWLVVDPRKQHKGFGEALVKKLISYFKTKGETKIFLHTQPWSYEAIGVYSKCGFRVNCRETFKNYLNQGDEGLQILKRYMFDEKYKKLVEERIENNEESLVAW